MLEHTSTMPLVVERCMEALPPMLHTVMNSSREARRESMVLLE